jgi:hypothetical protein
MKILIEGANPSQTGKFLFQNMLVQQHNTIVLELKGFENSYTFSFSF